MPGCICKEHGGLKGNLARKRLFPAGLQARRPKGQIAAVRAPCRSPATPIMLLPGQHCRALPRRHLHSAPRPAAPQRPWRRRSAPACQSARPGGAQPPRSCQALLSKACGPAPPADGAARLAQGRRPGSGWLVRKPAARGSWRGRSCCSRSRPWGEARAGLRRDGVCWSAQPRCRAQQW